jgi:chromosome segregation protein
VTPPSATLTPALFLRSLQLLGFKTFARHTEIRFEGGVTAIVGPNGSGKTNIVDGFKWALGSGQARDIRGRKMEEVIYAGGERRNRASFAEVTIVFDNTAGRLPVDYHEVAIKRRVERDGESDYFLNGTRVRRRDLIHILASTGLTVDSYAIIDQHDIEHIVTCSAAERRALLEEAAQVRGVKARRQEAGQKLGELAQNLLRLEDLRGEIEPRLEVVRLQATTAREAAEAMARLELLRGSIVWEEWREARDAHRRASSQAQGLERRLVEARELAATAESEFQAGRTQVQAAQDRRLERQREISRQRLELADADHALQMAEQRGRSQAAMAEALAHEQAENVRLHAAARALRDQLAAEHAEAREAAVHVPDLPAAPEPPDAGELQRARREAEVARRALAAATSLVAGQRTRTEFLAEQVARLENLAAEAERIPGAEAVLRQAVEASAAAEAAAVALARQRSELEGVDALRPAPGPGLSRLGDVLNPEPGYEAALSAVLGALVDAVVVMDVGAADRAVEAAPSQLTVLYPSLFAAQAPGSLLDHVRVAPGYERLAQRLLGSVVVGRDVTVDGFYREPGLVRAGADPRVELDSRRALMRARILELEPIATEATTAAAKARAAADALAALRAHSAAAAGLDESRRLLAAARTAENEETARLPELEQAATLAEDSAATMAAEQEQLIAAVNAHRAAAHQAELDRVRRHERIEDLRRQLVAVDTDLGALEQAVNERSARIARAQAESEAASNVLPGLREAAAHCRSRIEASEHDAPEEDAEMAERARRLVALEEARIDARLKAGTLEGSLGLIAREAELLAARMDEIRSRMPDGVAPEEIPGGKGREKEMRALERRLEEIGPTNALAEAECRELEQRFETLRSQLDDIAAAREDLEQLISKLREEEDSRYEAVFGAVAANFHEYFSQLTPGGRATLRHADGDDGPRSGVEILVQPPRKRLQNVTLLSSGERSLAALALVLALDEVNPSPFTILDEVDAALDDANVGRFGEMLARLGTQRQFLVITHNHVTMAHASTLYGIHLDESGSSHLVSVRLEDIRKPATRSATTTSRAAS